MTVMVPNPGPSEYERGLEMGRLHAENDHLRRQLDEMRERLDRNEATANVALDLAGDAHARANETHADTIHAEHVAEEAIAVAAESVEQAEETAEETAEEVVEDAVEDGAHDEEVTVVGEPESDDHHENQAPEPPKEEPTRRRRHGVYGSR